MEKYYFGEWASNVFAVYSLLIMNKYLGMLLSVFRNVDDKIFAQAEKEGKAEKTKDGWEVYGKVKNW
eukprot:CAMPEP_0184013154 /NCGR_PEP_ID=MMETSP0954-20121128/4849_1 /TAXON_ID=627963 /ORGANISM="Aplanochytrium sp, Strain PBS07" /LENGTH=66 /DNA_ID=CAMNT_0026293299 /DNA_START=169 /DNA_END=366 /DNA_ORIENTATION=+